jgi:hypothetical protein
VGTEPGALYEIPGDGIANGDDRLTRYADSNVVIQIAEPEIANVYGEAGVGIGRGLRPAEQRKRYGGCYGGQRQDGDAAQQ